MSFVSLKDLARNYAAVLPIVGRFGTAEGSKDSSADPEKVSVRSPTQSDAGKTVVTLLRKTLLPYFWSVSHPQSLRQLFSPQRLSPENSLVGEATATGVVPTQDFLPLFHPVLNIACAFVYLDHFPGRETRILHDESDPGAEFHMSAVVCSNAKKAPKIRGLL